ncbi:hypothetical protein [Oceanispirochaeta sp.]|nr:hypothetical protein [Oceanispirochaeta sp.]MDA3957773.1 hypothetical protein [Oceanispirochaeta sp.]
MSFPADTGLRALLRRALRPEGPGKYFLAFEISPGGGVFLGSPESS